MILEKIVVGHLETNCYIFGDEKEVVIIDPGADYGKIKGVIDKLSANPKAIINTHGHADHIGANRHFKLPIWIHKLDSEFLGDSGKNLSGFFGAFIKSPPSTRFLKDKETLRIGNLDLEVIHTPGHTPGGISLKHRDVIFTGDTLFREGLGRTDFPYGSTEVLIKSITKRLLIYDEARIYPGHGPESTIAWEKDNNPFLIRI